jgi:hypothetical protein
MRTVPQLLLAVMAIAALPFPGPAAQPRPGSTQAGPATARQGGFVPVKPLAPGAPSAGELRVGQGRFFSYAAPPGWRLGEDGQFALTLVAPDQTAFTVMVGNAGLAPGYPPDRFVHEKLSALGPTQLRLGPPRQARPVTGFAQAVEFDVSYVSRRGIPCRGVAKCNVRVAYDSAVYALTGAFSQEASWPGYASWLPAVADQVSATNGAAFGIRGVMAQNLRNSAAYAEAARGYREWSQKNWQGVVDQRGASQDRIAKGMREDVLGAVQPYASPFGDGRRVELPPSHGYYWMDRKGEVVGTDDPRGDPNVGSTSEWRRLERTK